ncbi:MAG: hypothetical protein H6704_31435 [Myxococcales bacterium]|nr:hypothetical protein [Planctomycetota bacterium]MCB9540757.1 hypothetical protein [Myxococcales bacterium]
MPGDAALVTLLLMLVASAAIGRRAFRIVADRDARAVTVLTFALLVLAATGAQGFTHAALLDDLSACVGCFGSVGEVDCVAAKQVARQRFGACRGLDVYLAGWIGLVLPAVGACVGALLAGARRLHGGRWVRLA